MEQRIVDGEKWGKIMLGRNRSNPSYRKMVDGKWVVVKMAFVGSNVVKAFESPNESPSEEKPDIQFEPDVKTEVELPEDKPTDNFGFSGVDEDTTEVEPENPLDNCSLKDLIETLYRRFGIYTCYLMREPNSKDIHPITGNIMNNFTLGQTRSQYMVARRSGANYNPQVMKNILGMREQSSFDFSAHYAEHPEHFEAPVLEGQQQMSMKEYREMRANQRPIMTTEHGKRGDGTDEDELYAEPPINGKIIRPFPSSPSAERRLRERREARGEF